MSNAISITFGQRLSNWKLIFDTCALPEDRTMDTVSKWLLAVRPCVFRMTVFSGAIGGLLAAATATTINWGYFSLALLGLVIAHAANNMINDYFDWKQGIDTEDYVRGQYTFHPILSGAITPGQLLRAILLMNIIDAAILAYFVMQLGTTVLIFALAGLFISVFYVAPPLKLKQNGLGELGVFIVWGPLMTAGTYFVAAGSAPSWVWLASIPYAIVVTTVLLGKHIDKLSADAELGIRTLPVLLGNRFSLILNQLLMASFYVLIVILVLTATVGPWVIITFLAIPRLIKVMGIYNSPRPTEQPPDTPTWPLWFVGWAFYHNKMAGGFFVLGLIMNLIVPVELPFL